MMINIFVSIGLDEEINLAFQGEAWKLGKN